MNIDDVANDMINVSKGLSGHLTEKEVRFLACLPFISGGGEKFLKSAVSKASLRLYWPLLQKLLA